MAIALPNNLVFVPLDVLTAEELNGLMANDSFLAQQFPLTSANIANGAIGNAQLATKAVKQANIDYSSIKYDEERVVGTSVDGKPVYSKTLRFTGLAIGSDVVRNHGITNVKDIWVTGDSFCYNSQFPDDRYPANYVQPTTATINREALITTFVTGSQIKFRYGTYYVGDLSSTVTLTVTLHYTKTTD